MMPEPSLADLKRMTNDRWARAIKLYFREHHKLIEAIQWDLIQARFAKGHNCALICYEEAVKRVRTGGVEVKKFRPRLNEPEIEKPMKKAGKKQASKRKGWNGYNACSLLRWAGKRGWGVEKAVETLTSLGMPIAEATARIQMNKGKKGLDVPVLNDEQIKTLEGK